MTITTRGLGFALGLAVAASQATAEDVTFRLSHWLPPQHPIAEQALKPWADSITAASGGTIKFEVFPSAQLGAAADHYDMARDGIADIAWLNPGFNAGRFPVFGAVQIPVTVANGHGGIRAMNDWYAKYAPQEMSDVKFCLAHMLSPNALHSVKQVTDPADISGMKIRPSSAMEATFFRDLGAATVPGGNPEAREMFSRGLIDGSSGVVGSQFVFGVMDVANYHLIVPFTASSFALVINKSKYDGLTDDQKKVIDDHCNTEAAVKFFDAPQNFEDEGMTRLEALADHTVTIPSPEVMEKWVAAAEPVRKAWAEEVTAKGYDAQAIQTELRDALRANNALIE